MILSALTLNIILMWIKALFCGNLFLFFSASYKYLNFKVFLFRQSVVQDDFMVRTLQYHSGKFETMRYLIFVLLFVGGTAVAQEIPVIKIKDLESVMASKDHDIHVINFWATWCGPCVSELPYFEALTAEGRPGVEVTLINLDFVDQVDRVKKFVKRRSIKSTVLLLDEIDYNSWIDRVEKSWSGTIPATLIINSKTGKRKFIGKELDEGDLQRLVEEMQKS